MGKSSACHGPTLSGAEAQRAAFACKQPTESPAMLSVHVAGHDKPLFRTAEDYRSYWERARAQFFAAGVRVIGYVWTPRFVIWLTCELEPIANEKHRGERSRSALKVIQEQYSRSYNEKYHGEGVEASGSARSPWQRMAKELAGFNVGRRRLRSLLAKAEASPEVRQHGENWMAHAVKVWLAPERVGEALRMMELLPQVFGLTDRPEEYPYSSLRAHLGLVSDELVDGVRFREWLPEGAEPERPAAELWREYLSLAQVYVEKKEEEDEAQNDAAKRALWTFRPWARNRPKEMTGGARHFGKAGVPWGLLEGGLVAENYCRVGWLEDLELWWLWFQLVGQTTLERMQALGGAVAGGGFVGGGLLGGELAAGGMPG